MLHEKNCSSCQAKNDYFDETITVSTDKQKQVEKDLSKFYKKLPPIQDQDQKLATRESLRSSRQNRNEIKE